MFEYHDNVGNLLISCITQEAKDAALRLFGIRYLRECSQCKEFKTDVSVYNFSGLTVPCCKDCVSIDA